MIAIARRADRADARNDVNVIVLQGAGRDFCAATI